MKNFILVCVIILIGITANAQITVKPDDGVTAPTEQPVQPIVRSELQQQRMDRATDFLLGLSDEQFAPYINNPSPCVRGPLATERCFQLENDVMAGVVGAVYLRRRDAAADVANDTQIGLTTQGNQLAFWAIVFSIIAIVVTLVVALVQRGGGGGRTR